MDIKEAKEIYKPFELYEQFPLAFMAVGGIDYAKILEAKGFIAGHAQGVQAERKRGDDLEKDLELARGALINLVDGIEYSSTESLNGKHSRKMPHDPDDAFVFGAHVFFKLIGDSYPKAKGVISRHSPKETK